MAAVSYARSAGLKVKFSSFDNVAFMDLFLCLYACIELSFFVFQALKLDLEFPNSTKPTKLQPGTATIQKTSTLSLRSGIFAGVVVLTSISVLVYLKRSRQ